MNKFRYRLANLISGGVLHALAVDADFYRDEYRKHLFALIQIKNATYGVKNGTGKRVQKICQGALKLPHEKDEGDA